MYVYVYTCATNIYMHTRKVPRAPTLASTILALAPVILMPLILVKPNEIVAAFSFGLRIEFDRVPRGSWDLDGFVLGSIVRVRVRALDNFWLHRPRLRSHRRLVAGTHHKPVSMSIGIGLTRWWRGLGESFAFCTLRTIVSTTLTI